MSKDKNYWFKRRRYGWGWFPVTWQGWLTLVLFLVLVVGGAYALGPDSSDQSVTEMTFYLLFVALLIAILLRIGLAKGPKPHWRWGKKPADNPDEDW